MIFLLKFEKIFFLFFFENITKLFLDLIFFSQLQSQDFGVFKDKDYKEGEVLKNQVLSSRRLDHCFDFFKVLEIRYDAQSAFIVNSLGKIKNLWMIVFYLKL